MYTRSISAVSVGVSAVAIIVAFLTIGGEEFAPLKDTLKLLFTHHWLGKSALSFVAFFLGAAIGWAGHRFFVPTQVVYAAIATTIVSSAVMTGYFILHVFHII